MTRAIPYLIPLASVLYLASCGGPTTTETKTEAPKPEATAPAAAPDPDAASIEGKVLFAGTKPVLRPVSMDATPACARVHTTPPAPEEVIVNSDGSLRNVFVYVKSGLPARDWPVPSKPVTIDQAGCIYKPHVVGVMASQDVEFLNSDTTNHNIHPLPRINREWNESQAPKGDPKIKSFPKEEIMIPVKCNLHPWMRTYIGVLSHPFFAVTGAGGTFTLKDLPPGEYTIEAWHERYGAQEAKVKVGPRQTGQAAFTFKGD